MTDYTNFAKKLPGAEEGAFLALALFNDLLGLLGEKGVLSPDEITGLLESTAHSLSQNKNAFAKRGAWFIRDAILPEH